MIDSIKSAWTSRTAGRRVTAGKIGTRDSRGTGAPGRTGATTKTGVLRRIGATSRDGVPRRTHGPINPGALSEIRASGSAGGRRRTADLRGPTEVFATAGRTEAAAVPGLTTSPTAAATLVPCEVAGLAATTPASKGPGPLTCPHPGRLAWLQRGTASVPKLS